MNYLKIKDKEFNFPYYLKVYNEDLKRRPFEVMEEINFIYKNRVIRVNKGYRTDFASVPRFFHRVVSPVGRHGKAAIVHDFLCDEVPHSMDYKEAAQVFKLAMQILQVPKWRI